MSMTEPILPHPTPIDSNFYKNMFSLDGKTAIVTGGAGHLGKAFASALADFGAKVIVTGRTEEKLKDFIQKANLAYNNRLSYKVCDVTDIEKFKQITSDIFRENGSIDILVNCAFNEQRKEPEDMDEEHWANSINNISNHVFHCTMAVLPYMKQQNKGSIINIASLYGHIAPDQDLYTPGNKSSSLPYAFGKGGVLSLTKNMAAYYAKTGFPNIRFNTISPGHFPKPNNLDDPDRLKYISNLGSRPPMKRIGFAEELGGACIYLASDASSYVTGSDIMVDGGWSII
jgi:NAD(P)-dependent dehydrogenase (short-subunit alcohol dehydrogenase family)